MAAAIATRFRVLWWIRCCDMLHTMLRRTWLSLLIGGTFVGTLLLLGHHNIATPLPFWLLLPGLLCGAAVPGSGFDLKEDNPLSIPATLVVYAVNVAIYSGLAYLLFYRGRSIILSRTA